jgi:hypothetical protein
MTAIFLVDDTLTSYKNSFIHDNFLYFAFNLTVVLPRSFRAHTLAAICTPMAYSLDDSLSNTFEEKPLENMTSKIVDLALFVFLQKLLMIT